MPAAAELAWLIPVLPLLGACLSGLGLISFNRTVNRLRRPVAQNRPRIPSSRPKSPTRLTTKAFWAAWAAPSRSYQKPTSR